MRVFINRNAKLKPTWSAVDRRTIDIAAPAIGSLIHTQGIGDLYRIYVTSMKDGVDYSLAYKKEDIDTTYMKALFDYGYKLAEQGYPWKKTHPGLGSPFWMK